MSYINKEKKGSAYVLISGLLYGLLGYFGINIINHDISINNMLFWRFLIASLVIISIIYSKKLSYQTKYKDLLKSFIYGALFYSGGAAVYFYSAEFIGTGLAMTIFFVYPTMIILFNWLKTKQPINKVYYTSMILTLIGLVLLVDKNEFTFDLYGVILAIISAISYAAYIICSKKQLATLPPMVSTLMVSLGSCSFFLVISIIDGSFKIPVFATWFYLIGIGVICTALPILLLLEGLQYINSEKAAILSVLEPVAVVVFGFLLLDETMTFLQFLGVIIMLSSAVMIQLDKLKLNS